MRTSHASNFQESENQKYILINPALFVSVDDHCFTTAVNIKPCDLSTFFPRSPVHGEQFEGRNRYTCG